MSTFGDRLRALRKERGLTGEELGAIFNVTKTAISNWENGNRFPDEKMLLQIAEFFNVTIDYLLGRRADPTGAINDSSLEEGSEGHSFTAEELEILKKIKDDPEISILFHGLKDAPRKKIKQLIKTWKFIEREFDNWDSEEK